MAEPFIAEIRIFACNFPPRGWAWCDGQLLPISQNTAFFSLVGTTYGGDGETTFGVPDLKGRAPMHPGRGPGLTQRVLGQKGGVETVTLTEAQMPSHNHALNSLPVPGDSSSPAGGSIARTIGATPYRASGTIVPMASTALAGTGGTQAHNNMQPYLALYFCIALTGTYPS